MLIETAKLIDEIEELKKDLVSKIDLDDMTEDEFKMLKRTSNLLDLSTDVMQKQAVMLCQMDNKLDKILSKMEES